METGEIIAYVRDKIEDENLRLPVFNRAGLELADAMSAEDYSVPDCARIILGDQALAANILREANSVFYGRLVPVETIEDAIVRLGANEVLRLTYLVTCRDLYSGFHRELTSFMEKLWTHSLAVGTGAAWLAQRSGFAGRSETVFLAGLMHDIGGLLVVSALDELLVGGKVEHVSSETLLLAMKVLHVRHGALVLRRWNMPEVFIDAALSHHALVPRAKDIPAFVALADQVCTKIGLSLFRCDTPVDPERIPALRVLGISPDELGTLARELHANPLFSHGACAAAS